jgi:hypothetical protein
VAQPFTAAIAGLLFEPDLAAEVTLQRARYFFRSLFSDAVSSSKLDAPLGAGYRKPRLFPPRYQPAKASGPVCPLFIMYLWKYGPAD